MSLLANWRTRLTADSSVIFGQPAFAGDASALGEQMAAVRVADVLAGHQPQPAEERQRLVR